MDLENQQRVKDAAEKYGAENVVVILGSSDPEGAEIYAETVTLGDPTFAGPLAGVPLGLCVCHVLERNQGRSRCRQVGRADRHDGNGPQCGCSC